MAIYNFSSIPKLCLGTGSYNGKHRPPPPRPPKKQKTKTSPPPAPPPTPTPHTHQSVSQSITHSLTHSLKAHVASKRSRAQPGAGGAKGNTCCPPAPRNGPTRCWAHKADSSSGRTKGLFIRHRPVPFTDPRRNLMVIVDKKALIGPSAAAAATVGHRFRFVNPLPATFMSWTRGSAGNRHPLAAFLDPLLQHMPCDVWYLDPGSFSFSF